MVAVAPFIPDDPKEKESVLAVLREHPELQDFIARVSEKAAELFPSVRIALDTIQYDEWDPPIRMVVFAQASPEEFENVIERFIHWYSRDPGFDLDQIVVMPLWDGPVRAGR